MTCAQPDGSIADGPVNFGLEEYTRVVTEPMADIPGVPILPKATLAVTSEPAIMEVAVTSEPALD